jgi:hypothetical protein
MEATKGKSETPENRRTIACKEKDSDVTLEAYKM